MIESSRPPNERAVGSSSRRMAVEAADEALLAELGYKQEFRRAFTPLEVRPISENLLRLSSYHQDRCLVSHSVSSGYFLPLRELVDTSLICALTDESWHPSSVLFYALPNGGPSAMVWGVSLPCHHRFVYAPVTEHSMSGNRSGLSRAYSSSLWACRWQNLHLQRLRPVG